MYKRFVSFFRALKSAAAKGQQPSSTESGSGVISQLNQLVTLGFILLVQIVIGKEHLITWIFEHVERHMSENTWVFNTRRKKIIYVISA